MRRATNGEVLAIDPGPTDSGVVLYGDGQVWMAGTLPNRDVLALVRDASAPIIAVEMVASYGMPVGREVFETCVWIGRLQQASPDPEAVRLVPRLAVKLHHCHSARATDATIWRAILDRFGGPAAAKKGGPLAGVKSHARAALALALTVADGAGPGSATDSPSGGHDSGPSSLST